jgi:hypothetical protein
MSRERQPEARIRPRIRARTRARLLGLACRPDIQKDTRDDSQGGTRAQHPVPAARLGRQESVS